MTNDTPQRMLLSHNFDISDGSLPALSRTDFAAIFIAGLAEIPTVHCRLVENPHWIVEILFAAETQSPVQIGDRCAHLLADYRRSTSVNPPFPADILILGGIKTTPAISAAPDSLRPGEWGVDVVETPSAERFLQSIAWDATIAQKPTDSIFKIELNPGAN